jgi:predicted ATPase/class 3 adenylate cyclase
MISFLSYRSSEARSDETASSRRPEASSDFSADRVSERCRMVSLGICHVTRRAVAGAVAHDLFMRELPAGTVSFLFTDIEGSTRLLCELGVEGYASELAGHRRVLREAFVRFGGVEVDTQGDAFFAAFPTAAGALAAAREAQRELSLPVRMGVHTGTPLLSGEGYVGADVHRAARIAAAGHGGQVLVSAATVALVDRDELRDLGEYRLKDLSAPERIFQLGDGEFPPLKTLYRTNLPIPVTPFLGRERELADVRELLACDDARLLTLTGAGGSGKTRLALQAAGEAAEAYPDGVWWVPLAPLADPADVGPAAARALGGGGALPELVDGRRLLLVFDNFEHLVEAAPLVAAVLTECPYADVLVTSRERLRVQGEQVYPVPVLARAEARQLFVTRARAARPDFEPDEHLDELCERLDDLPLALELAAARASLLSPAQLLKRLADRLDLLRGGRDAERRQETLRATIEWSYELLDPGERRLFAALSVFRGGWTLEAAEKVADADLELLQSLLDKSLIRRWESGRFGMLETIREFAAERLQPTRRDELGHRLLEHLLGLFESANLGPRAIGEPDMAVAQEERANVEAALDWAANAGEPGSALALMLLLELYWATNDPMASRKRIDQLLDAAGDGLAPRQLAHALRLRGATYDMTGRPDLGTAEYERAVEILQPLGDEPEIAHLMGRIASAALHAGEVERAVHLAGEALEVDRRHGQQRDEAMALNVLSRAAFERGDAEDGLRLAYESAEIAKAVDFIWWHGGTLLQAAEYLIARGDPASATGPLLAGLESLAAVDDRVNLPIALAASAALASQQNNPARAGLLWGAVEAAADNEPRPTTNQALVEYEPYLNPVRGATFDKARQRGRSFTIEDAVTHMLTNLEP